MNQNDRKLKYPVGVWHHLEGPKTYAFPLGPVETPWGEEQAFPALDVADWGFKGALPAGMIVKNIATPDKAKPTVVRGTLAGVQVYLPRWALEDRQTE
jgi:hypothetical protein